MDLIKFGDSRTGDLVEINLSRNITHAFLPNFLPPQWQIPDTLWPLVAEARAKIARLDGLGSLLPNQDLFARPLQHREAQASSQLEGTITSPKQQLLFELEDAIGKQDDNESDALREVANYRKALEYFREIDTDMPISLWLIRQIHSILLKDVRGYQYEPGTFRQRQVHIGRPARFVPPPPYEIATLLQNLETHIDIPCTLDPLVDAFILHYQFETIHPFYDGNGRVGRLLLTMMIARRCQLKTIMLYMSAFFDAHRDTYFDLLFNISARGDWGQWIEFCLQGVIQQAMDTEQRCQQLLDLSKLYREKLSKISRNASLRLQTIVDQLFVVPLVQVSLIRKDFGIDYKTAQKDIDVLVELGILEEQIDAKLKTYYCQDIMEIIYEDVAIP